MAYGQPDAKKGNAIYYGKDASGYCVAENQGGASNCDYHFKKCLDIAGRCIDFISSGYVGIEGLYSSCLTE